MPFTATGVTRSILLICLLISLATNCSIRSPALNQTRPQGSGRIQDIQRNAREQVRAQADELRLEKVRVVLKDGLIREGTVLLVNKDTLTLQTEDQAAVLAYAEIQSIEGVEAQHSAGSIAALVVGSILAGLAVVWLLVASSD